MPQNTGLGQTVFRNGGADRNLIRNGRFGATVLCPSRVSKGAEEAGARARRA